MPHYDYQCNQCGLVFEEFHNITAEPVKECPECRGEVKRLIGGGAGVIFKGSGFYKTDYRKAGDSSCEKKSESSPACASCPAAKTE